MFNILKQKSNKFYKYSFWKYILLVIVLVVIISFLASKGIKHYNFVTNEKKSILLSNYSRQLDNLNDWENEKIKVIDELDTWNKSDDVFGEYLTVNKFVKIKRMFNSILYFIEKDAVNYEKTTADYEKIENRLFVSKTFKEEFNNFNTNFREAEASAQKELIKISEKDNINNNKSKDEDESESNNVSIDNDESIDIDDYFNQIAHSDYDAIIDNPPTHSQLQRLKTKEQNNINQLNTQFTKINKKTTNFNPWINY